MTALRAPFPWPGGKARWADIVRDRFGDITVYVEPFAGSLAILLARPPAPREIVCDTDSMVTNFWRAMAADPEAVAQAADWPTFHDDLNARRKWLAEWRDANAGRLVEDMDYCDAKAAGLWAWAVSNWIGSAGDMLYWRDKIPNIPSSSGDKGVNAQRHAKTLHDAIPRPGHPSWPNSGEGIQVQRKNVPLQKNKIPKITASGGAGGVNALRDRVPNVNNTSGGQGVQPQREELHDKRPQVKDSTVGGNGVSAQRLGNRPGFEGVRNGGRPQVDHHGYAQGVQAQRTGQRDWQPWSHKADWSAPVGSGLRLLDWFLALQQRLARVIVINRSWESAVTPTLLQHTPTSPKPPVGIVLDPPYRLDTGRTHGLYTGDEDATDVAVAAYEWAVEHGHVYRIAYFMHEGDFPIPDGWDAETLSMPHGREGAVDMCLFSPACVRLQERLL